MKDLSLVETVLIEVESSKNESPLVSLSATIPLTSANNIRIALYSSVSEANKASSSALAASSPSLRANLSANSLSLLAVSSYLEAKVSESKAICPIASPRSASAYVLPALSSAKSSAQAALEAS